MKTSLGIIVFTVLSLLVPGGLRASSDSPKKDRPRQVFAHYMGCFPLGYGPMQTAQYHEDGYQAKFRHDSPNAELVQGGRFRTWPLAPESIKDKELDPVHSADIEIRRAMHDGIDGFDVDAWAGGDMCKRTVDYLFEAAEAGHYKFQITICIDAWCVGGPTAYFDAVKYLIDKHGKSPNLARRDGKPLIFTYQAQGITSDGKDVIKSEGWDGFLAKYRDIETRIGQPLFFYWDISQLFMGQETRVTPGLDLEAGAYLSKHNVGAIGGFNNWGTDNLMNKMGEAVHTGTADWCPPLWWEYWNIHGAFEPPRGIATLSDTWKRARDEHADLLQFVTWNDYGEHTSLAPTEATGYGIGELNAYYAKWWKTGIEPKPDHDQVFVTYRVHVAAKAFPFTGGGQIPTNIQVITILPKEAQIHLPGRSVDGKEISYTAPQGFSIKEFPLTVGPINVELARDGKTSVSMHSREPVTDLPFIFNALLWCMSSDDAKDFQEDFPGETAPSYSYYADDDHNGLPNWFEMYWVGKWNDFSTATGHDPKSDPFKTGQTLMNAYKTQTDPTKKAAEYNPGLVWDIQQLDAPGRASFNPDKDEQGTDTWFYLYKQRDGDKPLPHDGNYAHMFYAEHFGWWSPDCGCRIEWALEALGGPAPHYIQMWGRMVVLGWQSPFDGTVDIDLHVIKSNPNPGTAIISLEDSDGKVVWNHTYDTANVDCDPVKLTDVKVKAGSRLYLINDGNSAQVLIKDYKVTIKSKS